MDPPPIELSLPLDLVPKPSFHLPMSVDPLSSSLSGEPIPISIQESFQVQKKSRRMKQSLGGMSPASRHHVGVKPLASLIMLGEKYQPMDIMLGRKPTNGYHSSIVSFFVSSSCKNETNPQHNFSLFQACVKMKPTLSTILFSISSSCKNETNPKHNFILYFKLV
jgi:hypothetical protein